MAQVRLAPLGICLTVEHQTPLLRALQRAKVDLAAHCNGQGTCGTCALKVLEGTDHLSPMQSLERSTLMNVAKDPAHYRLTCQTALNTADQTATFHLDPKSAKKLIEICKRLENRISPRALQHPLTGQTVVEAGQPITRAVLEQLLSYL